MKSLNQLAYRLFRENKFLVFTSIMSIAIAVSLVITMSLFAVNAKQTLENDLREMYGDLDIALVFSDDNLVENEKELYHAVSNHASTISVSEALVTQAYVAPLGGEVYALGIENDPIAKSRYKTSVDLREDSVIITENLAKSLKLLKGDQIEIEQDSFEIVEVLKNAQGTGISPDMVMFTLERAKLFNTGELPKHKNETTALMVKTKEKSDLIAMANDFKKIQPGLRVDIIEQDEAAKSNLDSLNLFIVILSMLILIVTSIMVISNFDLFVYKNKNQFAIMRALGAKTTQLAKVIRIQSILITVAGALLGTMISYLANQFLQPNFGQWFSISLSQEPFAWEVAVPVLVASSMVIQLFLYIPVLKSSKILPLAILQENEELDFKNENTRKVAMKILWIISIVSLLFGTILVVNDAARTLLILLSAFLLLAGLFMAMPIWLTRSLNFLMPVFRRVFSSNFVIAIQNLKPQVKKNSFVILSISVVMIIAVFGSVLLNTIRDNNIEYINEQFPTSVVIKSRIQQSEINPSELIKEVRKRMPGVKVATVSTYGGAELLGNGGSVSFDYTLVDLEALHDVGVLAEAAGKDLAKKAIVSPEFAKRHGLSVGDSLEIGIYSEEMQQAEYVTTMAVSAISEAVPTGEVLFDWQAKALNISSTNFQKAYVKSTDESAALNSLETLKNMYPEVTVNTHGVSIKEASHMFLQHWAIFIIVLIVLVVSVIAGVFNTLLNNILVKRKEFAVLRTIGVKPWGVVKIVVTQISFYLVSGLMFGLVCGVLFSLTVSLVDPGSPTIDYLLILGVAGAMWFISLVIFIPVGWKIGNKKISLEILSDNK
ncbi:ABC transporter permease [Planococcus liqunii]|uniref:ABC transporter permease n=1 Tax=Planococcus liqunii TaxID=3058394 RepID=A0ABT8MTJ0_9BACL|nr:MULTISPECIES: FtsX-like permease family protein [unclassified Planococcus (in: firmicutes)]MDN7228225.1 ABC transporter permease [Planococcus sp. N064]WKA49392.1 ABC transporter permease [Planococcus sp. N056]